MYLGGVPSGGYYSFLERRIIGKTIVYEVTYIFGRNIAEDDNKVFIGSQPCL
jgi:hypothetical protein